MTDHEWARDDEADGKPSRIGWFAAGALAVIALIGALVMAATVIDWGNAEEAGVHTPPRVAEGY